MASVYGSIAAIIKFSQSRRRRKFDSSSDLKLRSWCSILRECGYSKNNVGQNFGVV